MVNSWKYFNIESEYRYKLQQKLFEFHIRYPITDKGLPCQSKCFTALRCVQISKGNYCLLERQGNISMFALKSS